MTTTACRNDRGRYVGAEFRRLLRLRGGEGAWLPVAACRGRFRADGNRDRSLPRNPRAGRAPPLQEALRPLAGRGGGGPSALRATNAARGHAATSTTTSALPGPDAA